MTTVAEGSTASVALAADQYLVASVPASGYARVRLASGAPGSPSQEYALRAPTLARTFGPYGVAATLEVAALTGSATYTARTARPLLPAQFADNGDGTFELLDPNGDAADVGGGGGSGISATLYEVTAAGNATIVAPGTVSGDYSEGVVIVRLLGSTGSYGQSGHILDGVLPPITQSIGAEVVLRRYTTDGGVTWHLRGVYPGEALGAYTWANLPAASACAGCEIVVTDYGYGKWRSDGTYWRPANGEALIAQLVGTLSAPLASVVGNGTNGRILYESTLPAGMIFPGCRIEVSALLRRNGSTEAGLLDTRVGLVSGTAGTAFGNFPAIGGTAGHGHKLASVIHAQASSFLQLTGSDYNTATLSAAPTEILTGTNFSTTPVYLQVTGNSTFTASSTLELLTFCVRIVG